MVRSIRSNLCIGAAGIGVAVFSSGEVLANGFAIRAHSAVGLGASFAGEGTPGMGLSAMFWNPAAVTQTTGIRTEIDASYVMATDNLTAKTGTSPGLLALGAQDNVGKTGLIPATYLAYQINSDWYAGLSLNVPYGLSTHADQWAGQQLALSAKAESKEATPVLGWRINDVVSVAAGPRILWLKGTFSRAITPAPGAGALPVELSASDTGYGFAAGATITPSPGTQLALGYRSQIDMDLHGHNSFPTSAALGPFSGTVNKLEGKFTLPDQAIFGARQQVTGALTLLGTIEWTGWHVVQGVPFTYTSGPAIGTNATTINFDFRDSWFFSGGGEYEWSPQLLLRAGIGYQDAPVKDAARSTPLPETNNWSFAAGLTYRLNDKLTLDLGYSYFTSPGAPINVVPGHPDFPKLLGASLVAEAHNHLHTISTGIRYQL